MASSNSVMNRVKMFEQSSPAESVSSHRSSRRSPSFGKQSPSPETSTWRTQGHGRNRNLYSPGVGDENSGADGTNRSFNVSPTQRESPVPRSNEVNTSENSSSVALRPSQVKSFQKRQSPSSSSGQGGTPLSRTRTSSKQSPGVSEANSSFTGSWSSPQVNKSQQSVLPSQIKSMQSRQSPNPSSGQDATPSQTSGAVRKSRMYKQARSGASSGVLESRKPSLAQTTPTHANLQKQNAESPVNEEVKKFNASIEWPSPGKEPETGSSKDYSVPRESPNPASNSSHDENEAPQGTPITSASKALSRQRAMRRAKERSTRKPEPRPAKEEFNTTTSLERSLNDASVVIQDEKESSIGSASSSQRSSLSVDELTNIAMRALKASREEDAPTSVSTKAQQSKRSRAERRRAPSSRHQSAVGNAARDAETSTSTKPTSEKKAPTATQAKKAPTKKKSRYEMFETARQRAGTRTPSPVMMVSSTAPSTGKTLSKVAEGAKEEPQAAKEATQPAKEATQPAKEATQPAKEAPSRMEILAAGRRKLSSTGPVSLGVAGVDIGGQADIRTQKSTDTYNSKDSEDSSVSDAHLTRNRRRRMARMTAHRHSPVPKPGTSTAAKAPSTGTGNVGPSSTKEPANDNPASSAKLSTKGNLLGSSVKSRSARLLQLSASQRASSPLFMKTGPKKVATGEDKGAKTSSKLESVVPKDESNNDEGKGENTPQAKSPAEETKSVPLEESVIKPVASRRESFEKAASGSPNRNTPSNTASSPGTRKPVTLSPFKGESSPTGSAFGSPTGSSRVSDHPALRAKRAGLHGSPRSETNLKSPKRIKQNTGKAVSQPITRPVDSQAFSEDPWQDDKLSQKDTSSEISSSHGGVKAAIDAWSSISKGSSYFSPGQSPADNGAKFSPNSVFGKESRTHAAETTPPSDSPGSYGARSLEEQSSFGRDAKQSDGSCSTKDDGFAVSSEVSVGGSHVSSFISSPSSYASSKMSVGAPGSFFRPMAGTDNDFEGTTNEHVLLGQLTSESTDEESSELPSHLFKTASNDEHSQSADTELSFLLEQMHSQSESEDSGIKLLTTKRPTILPGVPEKETNDQSTLIGQYHLKTSSEDSSMTTRETAENEPSTLIGQSILDSEEGPSVEDGGRALNEQHRSGDSSEESSVIKWWQNTDPLKRRQKFESFSDKLAKPTSAQYQQSVKPKTRKDSDEIFSGLSYDDASNSGASKPGRGSFGDDVFSGVTPSLDSRDLQAAQTGNSSATPSTAPSTFPPPPPPPPPQDSSSEFGTILVRDGSKVDSVDSDITSSVLHGDVSKDQHDWARRQATAVIQEELTEEVEDEEDTLPSDGDVLSNRRQTEGSIRTGNSHNVKSPKKGEKIYSGEPLSLDDTDEAIGFQHQEGPEDNSIFMNLGCKVMDSLRFTDVLCGGPTDAASFGSPRSNYQNAASTFGSPRSNYQNGSERHEVLSNSPSITQSPLNQYERTKWEEWEKQDSQSDIMGSSPSAKTAAPEVIQRRELAHRKLVQYAESAKSHSENDEAGSSPSEAEGSPHSKASSQLEVVTSPKDQVPTQPTTPFSVSQRRILEKFSSTLKHQGMEVLKLNRDKKWQTRFLTVSKEVLWLNTEVNGSSGDRAQCPLGILWTKRFSAGKDYGVSTIDRQGRGGVLFDQLVKVSASGRSDRGNPLSKKQQQSFKDSVAVHIEYATKEEASKCVIVRCKTTDSAHFLCTGLRVIMDVLMRENTVAQDSEI